MNYKSMIITVLFFFSTLFFTNSMLLSQGEPSATGAPKLDEMELPPGMTEDEVKALTEFMETLDPETLDALAAIGEEIYKEANELGIDPWDYVMMQGDMQKEYEEKAEKKRSEKAVVKPIAPVSTAEAQTAQDIFKGIAKIIPSIMQKAASDITLSNDLLPFKYRLDDLVYYFTRLADDKMLKYLGDPSFKPLIETAKTLYTKLNALHDQLYVEEFSLAGESPYDTLDIPHSASQEDIITAYDALLKITDPALIELQLIREGKSDKEIKEKMAEANARFDRINEAYESLRAKEEAQYILTMILDEVAQAVDAQKVLEQATKVLQLHDPEALKIKQEQEKLEANARKTQDEYIRKRPITSRSFTMPMPKQKPSKKYDRDRYDRDRGYTPSLKPKENKFKPSKLPSGKKDGKKPERPKGKDDKDKKDKDKKSKKEGEKKAAAKKESEKGKDGKKPSTMDVTKIVGAVENNIKLLKGKIKEHRDFLQNMASFATSGFANANEEAKKYIFVMQDLFAAFQMLDTSIKTGIKKFSSKKEELKQFKDSVAELIKKFEKSGKYKLIALLFSRGFDTKDAKSYYSFSPDKPIAIKGQNTPLNKEKANLIFTAAPEKSFGQEEEAKPFIDLIRETYKATRDKVMPKDEKKKPNGQPGVSPLLPINPLEQK